MQEIDDFIKEIKIETLKMVSRSKASHIGTCFSCADILGVLYFNYLNLTKNNLSSPDRDYFIMSKGHGSAAIYATLALKGFIPMNYLERYCVDDAKLAGHITYIPNSGVEISSGSLGHGLPIAVGIARSLINDNLLNKVVVLLSDGECQEGSNWEAFLMAPNMGLSNLTVIIDYNKLQGYARTDEISDFTNLKEKLTYFGWFVIQIDGHSVTEIKSALQEKSMQPKVIIANTVKGQGVSFMEDKLEWHYKTPNDEEFKLAVNEIVKK